MALVSRAQNVMSIAVLYLCGEVAFPAVFAKHVFARHHDWMVPAGDGEETNFALKLSVEEDEAQYTPRGMWLTKISGHAPLSSDTVVNELDSKEPLCWRREVGA